MKSLRIATRKSPLALWQANFVKKTLLKFHPEMEIKIIGMTTTGDKLQNHTLAESGGKGLFLKELQQSMLEGETDIAVHSMKDVPIELPDGFEIATVCKRDDPRDAFVSKKYQNLYALPEGAKVGTSSLRRVGQLKNAFPSLRFINLRGNIHTRLKKLDEEQYDAIILSAAGLIRMGLTNHIKQYIATDICLPAVGQGVIGIECKSNDTQVKKLLKPLNHYKTAVCLTAERAMSAKLNGGCHAPIAGYANIENGKLSMQGVVSRLDGSGNIKNDMKSLEVSRPKAKELGEAIGDYLIRLGANSILNEQNATSIDNQSKPSVILTRQERHIGNTKSILEKLEFNTVHIPSIEIQLNLNETNKLKLCESTKNFTDIIFVSRNAVEAALPIILQNGPIPPELNVMAMGAETAKELYKHGVRALFPNSGNGAEGLLKVKYLRDVTGRKILIIRGKFGLDWPAQELKLRGAELVESIFCYAQKKPDSMETQMDKFFSNYENISAIFLHSAISAKNCIPQLIRHRQKLTQSRLIVGSRNIAKVARDFGWTKPIIVAKSPSNKHMIMAIMHGK